MDLALPVGSKIPQRALNWIKQFAEQYGRPLIYAQQVKVKGRFIKQQDIFAYGPPDFQKQVQEWQEQGVALW